MFWNRSVAEGEGFEPPLASRLKRFSRPPVSTTHTSLREWRLLRFLHCTMADQGGRHLPLICAFCVWAVLWLLHFRGAGIAIGLLEDALHDEVRGDLLAREQHGG